MSDLVRLPKSPTTFIGRGGQVAEIGKLLERTRLLTLTGPAGCGKTRLALEAATELSTQFEDGVYWCDLSSLSDPSYLSQTLTVLLGSSEQPALSALESVVESIRARRVLLVLDNCEHLLDACAVLATLIVRRCPNCAVIATSLQPLGLAEELAWQVPPLELPEPGAPAGALADCDSIRLFAARAAEAYPPFTVDEQNAPIIASICRRLDGLPLAIELAASRVKLLTVDQIEQRLDQAVSLLARGKRDSATRHQALRATLDWAFQFLTDAEQALLLRISVFSGPFTLEMVESVCAEPAGAGEAHSAKSPMEMLELLTGLADKSFILLLPREGQTEASYRLLEVIRQYAREKLEHLEQAAPVRDRYLEWCLRWVEEAEPHLTRPEYAPWVKRFEWNQEHFRSALRWACTSRHVEEGLRLSIGLTRYWLTGGMEEGRSWLEELLGLEKSERQSGRPGVPDNTRAYAQCMSGRLAVRQGDDAHGKQRGEESLAVFRSTGEQAGLLAALNLLALVAQDMGDYPLAMALYNEALDLSRQIDNSRMTAVLLTNLGLMYYEQQEFSRAAPLWEEAQAIGEHLNLYTSLDNLGCLAMMQGDLTRAERLLTKEWEAVSQAGDMHGMALVRMDLGEVARRKGDLDRAQALLKESFEQHKQMSNRIRVGENLVCLGHTARNLRQFETARNSYESSLPYLEKTNYTRFASYARTALGILEAEQGHDAAALPLFYEGLAVAHRGNHRLCMVEALEEIAGVWGREGRTREAAHLVCVAAVDRERIGAVVAPVESVRYERLVNGLRSTVGDEVFEAIRSRAQAASVEEVIVRILGQVASPVLPPVINRAPSVLARPSGGDLVIHALGPTRVTLGGRVVAPGDWKYVKSKELFYYLVLNPPATKAQIGLDLWPDASPKQLRSNFHQAMHYLRRALGDSDWILYTENAYSFNHLRRSYSCDALEVEEHLRAARSIGPAELLTPQERARSIEHLEAARRLWRGDLLQDLDAGEWVLVRREGLRQSFLRSLLELGQMYIAEARYVDAASTFEHALTLDNYLESAHRGLMRALARQGDGAGALHHFNDLRLMMRNELGAEPSPETLLLYERLRRGDDV